MQKMPSTEQGAMAKQKLAEARGLREKAKRRRMLRTKGKTTLRTLPNGTRVYVRDRKDRFGRLGKGSASDAVRLIRTSLGLSQIEFARLTGYSLRSVAGWEIGRPLSPSARQKIAETQRLGYALAQIIPAKELGTLLRTPNPAFEGQGPIQIIERGESDRIWRMIFQIDANVAS
jgi:transcriptional regulator with XRE-family HTH domain